MISSSSSGSLTRGLGPDQIASLLFLPDSMWNFLYSLHCRRAFLLAFRLFSVRVSPHVVVHVFTGEGEFSIPLLHYLNPLICLFLIDLRDNSLFKIIIETTYLIMYAYVYILYVYLVCLYISEMNDSNDISSGRKEIRIVFSLEGTHTTCEVVYVIWKWTWISCKYILQSLGQPLKKYNWYVKKGEKITSYKMLGLNKRQNKMYVWQK